MTAALQLVEDDFDIQPVDVRNNPLAYRSQVGLARMLVRFLEKMPLDDMSQLAHNAHKLAVANGTRADAAAAMQSDLHVIEILASAQRQLTRAKRDA